MRPSAAPRLLERVAYSAPAWAAGLPRAPSRRVVRIADRTLPFGGTWTYTIAPDGDASRLSITEDGEIYNVIFRFVARFFMGYTSTMDEALRDIARKFGE